MANKGTPLPRSPGEKAFYREFKKRKGNCQWLCRDYIHCGKYGLSQCDDCKRVAYESFQRFVKRRHKVKGKEKKDLIKYILDKKHEAKTA